MAMFKNIDGVRVQMTAEEEAAFIAQQTADAAAVLDAEQASLDALIAQIDRGRTIVRALGVKVFQLEKASNPDLTAAEFKQSIKDLIEGF